MVPGVWESPSCGGDWNFSLITFSGTTGAANQTALLFKELEAAFSTTVVFYCFLNKTKIQELLKETPGQWKNHYNSPSSFSNRLSLGHNFRCLVDEPVHSCSGSHRCNFQSGQQGAPPPPMAASTQEWLGYVTTLFMFLAAMLLWYNIGSNKD